MDPEVASDIVALLGKELKACRETIRGLRNEIEVARQIVEERNERIAAAESAMALLHKNIADVCDENQRLQEQVRNQKTVVKKEESQGESLSLHFDENASDLSETEEVTDEYIQKLRDALLKYFTKYKEQKSATKDLVDTVAALEDSGTKMRDENSDLRHSVEEARERQNELTAAMAQLQESISQVVPKKFEDIVTYMTAHKTNLIPHPQHSRPIAWARRHFNLQKYLEIDCNMPSIASQILYSWGRFSWCSDEHHTGVILGPVKSYDLQKKRWSDVNFFEKVYSTTAHLFFEDGSFIYYAGLFQTVDLRQINVDGVDFPGKGMSSMALAEATVTAGAEVSGHKANDQRYPDFLYDIADLYLDQILKVECLGLRFVEFDEAMHGDLSRRFERIRNRDGKHHPGSSGDLLRHNSKRQKLS